MVAVRPHVTIRSLTEKGGCLAVKNFGELLKGPHKYPFKAQDHQNCANAYFRGELGKVRKISHLSCAQDKISC
jgi:hypothetical protein